MSSLTEIIAENAGNVQQVEQHLWREKGELTCRLDDLSSEPFHLSEWPEVTPVLL